MIPAIWCVVPAIRWSTHLEQCLETVIAAGQPAERVLVAFDGLADVPAELTHFPGVRSIWWERRRGYGAACNTAISELLASSSVADADCVAVLNDDVRLPAEWSEAARLLMDPSVGVVGFAVEEPAGSRPDYPGHARADCFVHERPTVAGCAFLMRIADMRALGGFDETYGMYGEETDLFARVQKRGLLLVESPIVIWHEGESTMATFRWERLWHGMRNTVRYAVLNESPLRVVRAYAAVFIHALAPENLVSDEPHVQRKRAARWWQRLVALPVVSASLLLELPFLATRRLRGGPNRLGHIRVHHTKQEAAS